MHSAFLIEKKVAGSDCALVVGSPPPSFWRKSASPFRRILWIRAATESEASLPPANRPRIQAVDLLEYVAQKDALAKFLEKSLKHLPSLFVCKEVETNRHYEPVLSDVFELLEAAFRSRTTRQKDACVWQMNALQNIPEYLDRRLPENSQDLLTGRPAWVVGAAPSLDHSIHALRQIRDLGVLFAADSAWRALRTHGIEPDFVVSIDSSKTAERCTPEGGAGDSRVVLCLASPVDWSTKLPAHQRLYLSSNQMTHVWLEKRGVPKTPVPAAVNCGVTALRLAHFLGCAPIYLFGMDFALDPANPSGRHHAGWSDEGNPLPHAEKGQAPGASVPRIPGNFCEEVPTHAFGEWKEINHLLAAWPPGLVHVVTDRGARLANTCILRPGEFLTQKSRWHQNPAPWSFPACQPSPAATRGPIESSLHQLSTLLQMRMPLLEKLLKNQDADAAARVLFDLIREGENGLMLGAFVLKWTPHLLPPTMKEPERWRELLGELEQLTAQMGNLRFAPKASYGAR